MYTPPTHTHRVREGKRDGGDRENTKQNEEDGRKRGSDFEHGGTHL